MGKKIEKMNKNYLNNSKVIFSVLRKSSLQVHTSKNFQLFHKLFSYQLLGTLEFTTRGQLASSWCARVIPVERFELQEEYRLVGSRLIGDITFKAMTKRVPWPPTACRVWCVLCRVSAPTMLVKPPTLTRPIMRLAETSGHWCWHDESFAIRFGSSTQSSKRVRVRI